MAGLLADGGSRDDAIALLSVDQLGDDPVAAIERALARQQAAFERPDVDVRVFHHPAGDMPGSQVIMFRLGDLVVHTWDLARAIGADEALDSYLADVLSTAPDEVVQIGDETGAAPGDEEDHAQSTFPSPLP